MKTETTLTFNGMSRELLEAELNRCNGIMVADGQRIGRLKVQRDELLAALEATLKVVQQYAEHDKALPFGREQFDEMIDAMSKAKYAIAKAGGKDGGK